MGPAGSKELSKQAGGPFSPFYHVPPPAERTSHETRHCERHHISSAEGCATFEDKAIAEDLKDTLAAHRDTCAGLAANMIGFAKAIIAFRQGKDIVIMYNPERLSAARPYEAEEGCLSLSGERKTTRYEEIEIKYRDQLFRMKKKRFKGFVAEVIQHEMDHLEGKLI